MNTEIDLTKLGKIGTKLLKASIQVLSVLLIIIAFFGIGLGPMILFIIKGSGWYFLLYLPIIIVIVAFFEEIAEFLS